MECTSSPSRFQLVSQISKVSQVQDLQRKEDILQAKKTEMFSNPNRPQDLDRLVAVADPHQTPTSNRPIQKLKTILWQLRMIPSQVISLHTVFRSHPQTPQTLRNTISFTRTITTHMRKFNITTATKTIIWSPPIFLWCLTTTPTTKTKLTKSETSSIMETITTES